MHQLILILNCHLIGRDEVSRIKQVVVFEMNGNVRNASGLFDRTIFVYIYTYTFDIDMKIRCLNLEVPKWRLYLSHYARYPLFIT